MNYNLKCSNLKSLNFSATSQYIQSTHSSYPHNYLIFLINNYALKLLHRSDYKLQSKKIVKFNISQLYL